MPETKTDSGTIRAGEKSATVNKETVKFDVPADVIYKYEWVNLLEADVVLESEHVTLTEAVDAINTIRKNNARQNAYMNALAPYKPDTMTPEQRIELAVRNLVQAGVPETLARQSIAAMRA